MPGGKLNLQLPVDARREAPPLTFHRCSVKGSTSGLPSFPDGRHFIFGNQAHRSGEMQLLADEVIE
jgi:hypothetical protein